MAVRPYWKGQIRLALVSIPVEIYSATKIALIQSFYLMAAALSVARDFDPDAPPYLRKVTETL